MTRLIEEIRKIKEQREAENVKNFVKFKKAFKTFVLNAIKENPDENSCRIGSGFTVEIDTGPLSIEKYSFDIVSISNLDLDKVSNEEGVRIERVNDTTIEVSWPSLSTGLIQR